MEIWPKIWAKQESDLTTVQLKQDPPVYPVTVAKLPSFLHQHN